MNTTHAHAAATTRETTTARESAALTTLAQMLAKSLRWRARSYADGLNAAADRQWSDLLRRDALDRAADVLTRLPSPTGHYCAVTVRRPEAGGTGVTVTVAEVGGVA